MDRPFVVGTAIALVFTIVQISVKQMPTYIATGGIAFGVALALLAGLPDSFRPQLISCVLYILAISLFAAGVSYQITGTGREAPLAKLDEVPSRIVVECQNIAFRQPLRPKRWVLYLFQTPVERGGMGIQEVDDPPGAATQQAPAEITHLCTLTNYAPAPLINVSIPLRLSFSEAIITKLEGGGVNIERGALSMSRPWVLPVPSGLIQTDGSLGEWQKSATSGALQGILLLRPNH